MWKAKMRYSSMTVVCLVVASIGGPAAAATLIYEGFSAGGTAPVGAGQYVSQPASTTGQNNNSLIGQGPAATGFNAGTNWALGDAVSSAVYPRVLDAGLNYTDTSGNTLNTQAGAADWHRAQGSAASGTKRTSRNTNLSPSLPNTGYFSALMQFTPGIAGRVELQQHDGGGGNPREFFFGFNGTGSLIAGTSNDTNVANNVTITGPTFAPNNTYLIFGELVNDAVDDNLRIWVNPADLSDPTAGPPTLASLDIGSGWVGGNASFTIRQLRLFSDTPTDSQFIFDEIRVGDSIGDVLPFTAAAAVPEPASVLVWLVGAVAAALCYRRVRR
jgi:hypothetical protein